VAPKLAIYSAGYKSRFGHPSDEVKERFKRLGISTYNTADLGGIRVRQQFSAKLMSSNTECEENAFLSYSNECFVIEFAREHLKKIWIDSPIESIETP
jgi:hypothetical protein